MKTCFSGAHQNFIGHKHMAVGDKFSDAGYCFFLLKAGRAADMGALFCMMELI